MSKKRPHENSSQATTSTNDAEEQVFQSSAIKDRASTFIAVYSPTVSAKTLQTREDLQSAMHRIIGWRKPSKQQSLGFSKSGPSSKAIFNTGSDDDGEKWAGRRIENVLTEMNVEGSVCVARWFGGVMLGPIRFNHIENVTREAISKWQAAQEQQVSSKRTKINDVTQLDPAEETRQKERLVRQLSERDNSIDVLRELLAEKQMTKLEAATGVGSSQEVKSLVPSPVAKPDYGSMSLQRLQQLDKARDATISWILKQIDAIETSTPSTKE